MHNFNEFLNNLQKCLGFSGGDAAAAGGAASKITGGFGGAVGALGGASKFTSSASPWAAVAGAACDTIGGFMPLPTEYAGDKGAITLGMDSAYDAISDTAMSIPGIGTIVGAAMKANKLLGLGMKSLGGGTDGMTTKDAILGSAFMQMTPFGLINGFGGKKSDTMSKDYATQAAVGAGYLGTYGNIDDLVAHAGKKYGKFSLNEMEERNQLIHEAGRTLNMLKTMAQDNTMAMLSSANMAQMNSAAFSQSMQGGYNQAAMRAARKGDKLFSKELRDRTTMILAKNKKGGTIEFTPFVFNFSCLDKKKEVEEFKEGGKMNVIPEGSLHARKHNMEDLSPELKGQITKKGVPVIIDKGIGEVELQAEIELNEIIFIKEVTLKLENLAKKYHSSETSLKEKDECAIEAGKILACEIMENTDDRTGLINTI